MFSKLRSKLVYPISTDISEHDEDIESDEWLYNGRKVFKGTFDPEYSINGLNVYWLYDENLIRVGLAEHEVSNPSIYDVLWFRDNAFSTLLQEEWTTTGETLWSKMTYEAYQDCLETNFKLLCPGICFITPADIIANKSILNYTGKKIFIDEYYLLFMPPTQQGLEVHASSESLQAPSEQVLEEEGLQSLPSEFPPLLLPA